MKTILTPDLPPDIRYAEGVRKYWSVWGSKRLRGDPVHERQARELGEIYKAAPTMSEEEFEAVRQELWLRGMNGGDLGYSYWTSVIDDLKRLRGE